MIDRFVRLFKSTDQDELRSIQSRTVDILKKAYPNKTIVKSPDPRQIEFDGRTCGLTNIHTNFLLTSQTDADLREIVINQFRILESNEQMLDDREDVDWESARSQLMPQLFPREFLSKIPLIFREFDDQVVLGFVVDAEEAYSYVSVDDARSWNVDKNELNDIAFQNLAQRSRGIEIEAFPRPNGFVVINTMDGFDAVRVTSNEIQSFIDELIGTPFHFGIPNRDFLICWEANKDKQFQNQFIGQIAHDFEERPYPLSPHSFEMREDGSVTRIVELEIDPRAESSEYN